jgi:hypothetical protein
VRVVGILGIVVVGRVRLLWRRVAVVALAHLAAAVVFGLALGLARAVVPVDVLPGPLVAARDQRAAATAVLALRRVAVLASGAGRHRLAGAGRLLV